MKKTEREIKLEKFFNDQLSLWPLARNNFRALKTAPSKDVACGGLPVKVLLNPSRAGSTKAETDPESIAARPCFLCPQGRFPQQHGLPFEGRKGKKYDILLNPYPILGGHLVIALKEHLPQNISHRFVDILDLGQKYQGHTFFYNGPYSGASAPDHHHFQAVPKGLLPLENDVRKELEQCGGSALTYLTSIQDADAYHYGKFTRGIFVIDGQTAKSTAKMFYRLLDCAPLQDGEGNEPRFNLISFCDGGRFRAIVIFRTDTRSHHYFLEAQDPQQTIVSPGCADMGGCFVTIRQEDFDKMDSALMEEIMDEVTLSPDDEKKIIWRLTRRQRRIQVVLTSGSEISFEISSDGAGIRKASLSEGKILYDGALYDELYFEENTLSTMFAEASFTLFISKDGAGKPVRRRYAGALRIIADGDAITAINVIGEEDYILSLIQNNPNHGKTDETDYRKEAVGIRRLLREQSSRELVSVPEHEYRGIARSTDKKAAEAVDMTWGEI